MEKEVECEKICQSHGRCIVKITPFEDKEKVVEKKKDTSRRKGFRLSRDKFHKEISQ